MLSDDQKGGKIALGRFPQIGFIIKRKVYLPQTAANGD